MVTRELTEDERVDRLLYAQGKAAELFAEVERLAVVAPGVSEQQASDAIKTLAADLLGVRQHWHKRIVRAGINTLEPYRANPPQRVIGDDDIVFVDFGPVFEAWEADFGRTYVLGNDPDKLRLQADLPRLFDAGRAHFRASPDLTGAQLFAHMVGLAEQAGWQWGGRIAGHLIGDFPHDTIDGDGVLAHILPGNDAPLRRTDGVGQLAHWILEVHLVDRARGFGGFHEQLLDIG